MDNKSERSNKVSCADEKKVYNFITQIESNVRPSSVQDTLARFCQFIWQRKLGQSTHLIAASSLDISLSTGIW